MKTFNIIKYHKSKIGMKQNPEYQNIYQYNPKIGQFCSTFRSIFAISVHEVHISTNQYEWPPWLQVVSKVLLVVVSGDHVQ